MKQRRNGFWVALIVFVLCAVLYWAGPTAARVDYSAGVCFELADTLDPGVWVSPGCELVDCCPGCPGNVIDWRIRVSGEPLEKAVLQFENLPPQVLRSLKIKGRARWVGSSLHVEKGETIVSGFKYDKRSAPPVAAPRLIGNKEAIRRLKEAADREDLARASAKAGSEAGMGGRELGRMEVVVDQLMGKYVVNQSRVVYNVKRCWVPPAISDHIEITNNFGNDNSIVLLDARDSIIGCLDDQPFRGNAIVRLGKLNSNGNCNSELAIFSDDNAMLFLRGVNAWDENPNKMTVPLDPILVAPVVVWIVTDVSGTPEYAEYEMATANYLFNTNNVGIAFTPEYRLIFNNPNAADKIGTNCGADFANVSKIRNSGFYSPNKLNVYFVKGDFTGKTCIADVLPNDKDDPNIIFIAEKAEPETLAHEFGHAFSLYDSNSFPSLGGQNIMMGGGDHRTEFSVGQAFHMNVNHTSMINVNGVRGSPVRIPDCVNTSSNNLCPSVTFDVPPPK